MSLGQSIDVILEPSPYFIQTLELSKCLTQVVESFTAFLSLIRSSWMVFIAMLGLLRRLLMLNMCTGFFQLTYLPFQVSVILTLIHVD